MFLLSVLAARSSQLRWRVALATAGSACFAALGLLFATMAFPSSVPTAFATTPTPSYTPTPAPTTVDFSITSGPSDGAVSNCSSAGAPISVCQVQTNALFKVNLWLNRLPLGLQGGKYTGYDAAFQFNGVTQDGTPGSLNFTPWPDCTFNALYQQPGSLLAGCAVGVGSPGSNYTGKLLSVEFRCVSDGVISIQHGGPGLFTHLVDASTATFAEGQGTTESLTIDCGNFATPTHTPTPVTPTPTPCPTSQCPGTPTTPPPVTPTPCPVECVLDFSISVTDVDGFLQCDSSGTPANTCDIPLGAPFGVDVVLHSIPSAISGYLGYDAYLAYGGLTLDQGNLEPQRWPDCYFDVYYADEDHTMVGCAVGIGAPPSTFTGIVTRVHFACDAPGSITLQHGAALTDLVDENIEMWSETGSEQITIDCVAPLAYPADSDDDGCPDARESTTNAASGGRRNFVNEWDYFNPTHDHLNRIDDVLEVLDQYFVDQGAPAYTEETDRTFTGPHAWNLGPPDGRQRIDDVLYGLHQYFHDCS